MGQNGFLIVIRTSEVVLAHRAFLHSNLYSVDLIHPLNGYMIYCRDLRNDCYFSFLSAASADDSLPALPLLPLP